MQSVQSSSGHTWPVCDQGLATAATVLLVAVSSAQGTIPLLGASDGDEFSPLSLACVGGDGSGLSRWAWPLVLCGVLLLTGCSTPLGWGPWPQGTAVVPGAESAFGDQGSWVLVLLPLFTG